MPTPRIIPPATSDQSAVVLIPPPEVCEPIQAIRRRFDRQVDRWMPHLTLIYPFWPRERFSEAIFPLGQACGRTAPFSLELSGLSHFVHGREHYTLYLVPKPAEPLIDLQRLLQVAFPDCDEQSGHAGGFTPHLSLGQAKNRAELMVRSRFIQEHWRPQRFEACEVSLLVRRGQEPFRVLQAFPLGAG